ncbi:MAG TPA: hypothetical protein VM012_05490 [Flavitalea sp.]|nr:hypothetical protein [Flavitalea sp.]
MVTADIIIQLMIDENKPLTLSEIENKLHEPAENLIDELITRGYLFRKRVDESTVYTTTTMAKAHLVRPLDDLKEE